MAATFLSGLWYYNTHTRVKMPTKSAPTQAEAEGVGQPAAGEEISAPVAQEGKTNVVNARIRPTFSDKVD